jgi:S-formylglutathione hydrolase FrmB
MALCELNWFSKVLDKMVQTVALLPDKGEPPFPTYYLLHGLSDDQSSWRRRTRIEWYVRDLPLIVVMPDGYRSFYTNHEQGQAFASYIAEELVGFIERHLPAKSSRGARCIGGLSMGGYGALRLALGYPQMFASANSHSGALLHGSRPPDRLDIIPEMKRIFGARPQGSDHDLLALAHRCKSAGKLPRLRIDCGHEDHLLHDNRVFHERLRHMNVAHEYEEFPGGHNWDYWDYHINLALMFHARNLRIKPIPD